MMSEIRQKIEQQWGQLKPAYDMAVETSGRLYAIVHGTIHSAADVLELPSPVLDFSQLEQTVGFWQTVMSSLGPYSTAYQNDKKLREMNVAAKMDTLRDLRSLQTFMVQVRDLIQDCRAEFEHPNPGNTVESLGALPTDLVEQELREAQKEQETFNDAFKNIREKLAGAKTNATKLSNSLIHKLSPARWGGHIPSTKPAMYDACEKRFKRMFNPEDIRMLDATRFEREAGDLQCMLAWCLNGSAFAIARKIVTFDINAIATPAREGNTQDTNHAYNINQDCQLLFSQQLIRGTWLENDASRRSRISHLVADPSAWNSENGSPYKSQAEELEALWRQRDEDRLGKLAISRGYGGSEDDESEDDESEDDESEEDQEESD
jgi:hypothetical protein